jgi:hypothetical protein
MVKIELVAGKRYCYRGHPVQFRRVLDLNLVIVEYETTGQLVSISVADLRPIEEIQEESQLRDDILSISK